MRLMKVDIEEKHIKKLDKIISRFEKGDDVAKILKKCRKMSKSTLAGLHKAKRKK